ncbi:hypothetical protein NLI96_g9217 [Meripilus lineatus]|uniref:HMG box domain-containing protein n=1 Tax=Meripilus lineatus TaxID=2056292 RepID=A0AAD5YD50_9APHY|nr:hypothetical protein NLI96_g9217 [Physisporinus lineatus]
MHRYNPIPPHPASSANPGQDHLPPHHHDRESSLSSSDVAPYGHYLHDPRDDADIIDDPHMALTTQTLNADGTPKRPMNAFMIFARKRRPEISAANQMMRTGDISKILSKEWSTMDMSDKKFYLDQAKKLKDNFNAKYPDYVYRRRPNNSRKKRRPDSDQHSPTDPSPADDTDDASMGDTSPIEGDYSLPDHQGSGYGYSRGHHPVSPATFEGPEGFLPLQTSPYSFTPDYPTSFPPGGRPNPLSGSLESSVTPSNIPPLRIPSLVDTSHSQNYPISSSQHLGLSRTEQGRSTSSWPVLPALDTSVSRQRTSELSSLSSRSDAFSPPAPHRPWSSSTSSSSSGGASGSHYPTSPFPTLASPFYPATSPSQRSADVASSPAHQNASQDYFPSPPSHHDRPIPHASGRQDQGGFSNTGILPHPTASAYLTGSHFQSRGAHTSPGQQRHPSSIQSIPSHALQYSPGASPPSSGTGPPNSQFSYWERKYEGR